jgi:hypothetical protein
MPTDRGEVARPRPPSLPTDPVTIPSSAPAFEQPPLSRLRQPTAQPPQAHPPAFAQPNVTQVPPSHAVQQQQQQQQQQRGTIAQQPQRTIPAVAPRAPTPYASAPPPGLRPPMPQRSDLPPLPLPPSAPPAPLPLPHTLLPTEPLEIVHAAAGLPAVVRRNVPVLVEIRVPRAQVDVPRNGPIALPPQLQIVRAVTTRLTGGPVSGLSIEPRTPETTWLGPADADNRDVIWQYVLLPTRAGTFAVTLSISGRTFAPSGMVTDASTAAETFAVRVKPERGRFWRRLLWTLTLLALGGALGWALTGPLSSLVKAIIEVARG